MNHKPLQFTFAQNAEKSSPRQKFFLDSLNQFNLNIRYLTEEQSTFTNALHVSNETD